LTEYQKSGIIELLIQTFAFMLYSLHGEYDIFFVRTRKNSPAEEAYNPPELV
jgi:hypothetical protein